MEERSVRITGMTCAACEVTVADAAKAAGAKSAKARAKTGVLVMRGNSLPTDRELGAALSGTPYSLGTSEWVTKDRAIWRQVTLAAIIVGVAAVLIATTSLADGLQSITQRAASGSILFVILLGVAASISTCMALVGGLVISISASAPPGARYRPHLAFNAGRIAGFALLGGVVGALGQAFAPSGPALALAMIAVAVVMGLLGIRLTGLSPRIAAWQFSLPASWGGWARRSGQSPRTSGLVRPALLGAATFFLPCGFTQAVQVMALTSGSAAEGALLMGAFALGTAPGLFAAGTASSAAAGPRGTVALRSVGVLVIAFALVTASGALNTLFPGFGSTAIAASERTANVVDDAGVQEVSVDIVTQGYSPADTVVYVGEPVELTMNPTVVTCAGLVDASALGAGTFDAVNEPATVEFTLEEPGTYTYNCRMGMYSGTVTAIERPAP
jgi:sulfite exporter TauE/SafE